jgi:hypothetical protein
MSETDVLEIKINKIKEAARKLWVFIFGSDEYDYNGDHIAHEPNILRRLKKKFRRKSKNKVYYIFY